MTDETTRELIKKAGMVILLLLAISLLGFTVWWFFIRSPALPDNPPATPAATVITSPLATPTATDTPVPTEPPTNTPLPEATATSTDTATPTATPSPTLIPSLPEDTPTPTPTSTLSIPESSCVGVQGGNNIYYTQPGDTLWSIAERCLGDPYRWGEICYLNAIRDCNKIWSDQPLILPRNRS